jgi:GNAT superfamily N-acetyltransferase
MAEGTNVDIGGIKLNVAVDGAEVIIRPIVDEYQAGYAVFDRDGNTLVPADLAIDEEFRGQGIAKIIYDYVKSLGFNILRSNDQTRAGKHFWDKNRGEGSQVWEHDMLDEACWKGYHKEGMKTMFGKKYPNCVKNTNEGYQQCPECGGPMFSEEMINEKKDACYYKVKSRYKVWPSAYASGALVQCRKKGANNWGTKSESSILEGIEQTDEDLHKWFKEKWVRFGPDGKIRGACARGDGSEGKPKCLPQSKAQNLGKKGRASAASRKRREDPNPERSGKAINVATKKKTTESSILQGISETKGLPMPGSYEQEYGPFKKKGGYRIMTLTSEQEELDEKWSNKYKRSIDCNHPKGFSQKAHCQGKKKK